jgi:NADH-quinone oxidoreductase subunit N
MAPDLILILPEILLAVFAMAALLVGAFGGGDDRARPILWGVAAFMALWRCLSGSTRRRSARAFGGAFTLTALPALPRQASCWAPRSC